jgi:hypothetical protein
MKQQTKEDEKRIAETIAKSKKTLPPPIKGEIINKKHSDWCAHCEEG